MSLNLKQNDFQNLVDNNGKHTKTMVFHVLEVVGAVVVIIALVVFGVYQYNNNSELRNKVNHLQESLVAADNDFNQMERDYENKLSDLQYEHDAIYEELLATMSDLESEQRRREDLQNDLEDLADSVAEMEKLAKIDREILKKYDTAVFLDEYYTPSSLSSIPIKYLFDQNRPLTFQTDALYFLQKMLDDMYRGRYNSNKAIDISVQSAYRRYNEQSALKGQYVQVFGANKAGSFSADQGYSEHQLGTAVDFTNIIDQGQLNISFENSEAFKWLEKNAYRYGFVLSYPKDNQFYIYEPWHWRFVGLALAKELNRKSLYLFEMTQTAIDKYLIGVFDR